MKKHPPPPPLSIKRARAMRCKPTEAEQTMWRLLRENFPNGRWRRQVSLQHYIADIASHRLRIVIELDGGQHSAELELTRTCAIEGEGYQLLRFWNNEVLQNSCGCIERLALIIKQVHPNPASTRRQAAKSSHPSPIKG